MIVFGIVNTIFSYVFGALVKCIGRMGCLIIAAALNYTAIALMYFWEPRDDQMYVLYVIASLWGIADAAWVSQVIGRILFQLLLSYSSCLISFSCLHCSLCRDRFKCNSKISSVENCWFSDDL
jgi:Na+/melibiose symporter-like transporter